MSKVDLTPRLVAALADAEGTDPEELAPPLTEWLDIEALEELLRRSPGIEYVEFTAYGHDVIVTGRGTISVDETPVRSEATLE